MKEIKLLVVDDEAKIRELVRAYLEREGFSVDEAGSGPEALERISLSQYDLIIMDLMMPGMDGLELCREIRKNSDVPVIMLTARGDEIDRVLGLELGADDYMVKPFSPRELVARIKAVLRRLKKSEGPDGKLLSAGDMIINEDKREVSVAGEEVALTPREYDLLVCLAGQPGRVFTREQLLRQVWGYEFFGEARTVDTHITRLREKLARGRGERQYIHTVWGTGYKFEVKN